MKTNLILSILLVTLCLIPNAAAQKGGSGNVKTTIEKVTVFGSPTVVPAAGSTVSRNNEGAYWNISTSSLPVGEVVTLWVAIFNNPAYCAQSVCAPPDLANPFVVGSLQYAGGQIVGPNGRADFSGYLGEGDGTGGYQLFPSMQIPAPGLVDTRGAQIHLVMRKHGPASADPATLQAQLSGFTGGCNVTGACANIQASIHR